MKKLGTIKKSIKKITTKKWGRVGCVRKWPLKKWGAVTMTIKEMGRSYNDH